MAWFYKTLGYFEGTVADNIAYGKKDASREEIIEAAKIAQCDHFIRPFLKDMTQLFLAKMVHYHKGNNSY